MVIDVISVLLVGYGFYLGFSQRIIQAFSMFLLIGTTLLLSLNLTNIVTTFLESKLQVDTGLLFFIGLIVSFVIGIVLIKMILSWFKRMISKDDVSLAGQLGTGLIIVSVLLIGYGFGINIIEKTRGIALKTKSESITYTFVSGLPAATKKSVASAKPLFKAIGQYISGNLEKNRDQLKRLKNKTNQQQH